MLCAIIIRTIIDTAGEIAIAVNATLNQYSHQTVNQTQVTSWIGHGKGWLMQQAWPNKCDIQVAETWKVVMESFMQHYKDVVVAGNTLPFKKPNPAVIEHCLEVLGESKQNSLLVGDSETDVTTAKNAGVICWVVPYGYNAGRDIATASPGRLIDSLDKVPAFFGL